MKRPKELYIFVLSICLSIGCVKGQTSIIDPFTEYLAFPIHSNLTRPESRQKPPSEQKLAGSKTKYVFFPILHKLLSDNSKFQPTKLVIQAKDHDQFAKRLTQIEGLDILGKHGGYVHILIRNKTSLQKLLHSEGWTYLGQESLHPHAESRVRDLDLGNSSIEKLIYEYPFLNGEAITLSVKETSMDTTDLDLLGRAAFGFGASNEVTNHATQMATIIGGAGNSSLKGLGVAPRIQMLAASFDPPAPDPDSIYEAQQSWVQNHSYGTGMEPFYGVLAEAFDTQSHRQKKTLHIFSVGNMGLEADSLGRYAGISGFSNLTGNFKMAKNVLTIGALDTVDRVQVFSSRGPAFDGRIKPELSAFSLEGTSNAAATVSGIAALLHQAYQMTYGDFPSSSLIKALLINGASYINSPGPDYASGFGKVDAYQSLQQLEIGSFFQGQLNQGEEKSLTIEVPQGQAFLKLTLAWTDPPSTPGTAQALVNDLDLRLISPSGSTIFPWVLSSEPNRNALLLPATRGEDHLNNIEQIYVKLPEAGTYEVRLKGFAVPQGPQDFSLVYHSLPDDFFEWSFPVFNSQMPYGEDNYSYFRWSSSLIDSVGSLLYSLDQGQTWKVLAEDINLNRGFWRWNVPDVVGKAQAKIVTASQEYITQEFLVGRSANYQVGFNCGEELFLNWEAIDGVESYSIKTRDKDGLKEILSTEETFALLNKNNIEQQTLRLDYSLKSSNKEIRGPAFDYELQGNFCYVRSFYAEPINSSGIRLNLDLGTDFGIEEIWVERLGNTNEVLGSMNLNGTFLTFEDLNPKEGFNEYQARIIRTDGSEVLSDIAGEFFIGERNFLVFPNPLTQEQNLSIYTQQPPAGSTYFILFDINGRELNRWEVFSERQSIDLSVLQSGIYFYLIQGEVGQQEGKVLVP